MGLWEPLFFWIFALGAVASSAAVLIFRNPLYSAISLILDFFFFAGLYVLLSAHFIAVTQILVYAGAIMVLFIFIIMLLNLSDAELGDFGFRLQHLLAAAVTIGLFTLVVSALLPMVDYDELERNQSEAVGVATASRIEGLYADLSEAELERTYRSRVDTWVAGQSYATGKYPEFSERRVPLPPVMSGTTPDGREVDRATFGSVEAISVLLVGRFVLPFELTALLLLAAIVGAVIIAKRRV